MPNVLIEYKITLLLDNGNKKQMGDEGIDPTSNP